MKPLFNIHGEHIANDVNGHLHSTTGENIGHYIERAEIYVDLEGNYLGEIYQNNRLVYNTSSPYQNTNYGCRGNVGNVGDYGNYGNHGVISLPANFKDVISE